MSKYKGKRFADKQTSKELKLKRKQLQNNLNDINNMKDDNNTTNFTNNANNINNSTKQPSELKSKNPKKRKANFIFNIITVICIIAIIFSSYNIVCWIIDNKNNNKLLSNIYEQTNITQEQTVIEGENINKFHYDFTNLLLTNPNTIGWINVKNTNIDYPIVKYSDNNYYLNHSFDNTQNTAGWIFADYQNKCDGSDYNTVIYGHNRKDKSMFGSLKNVLNSDWYSNEENLYINYSTLNETHVYKIFSTFICNDEDVSSYLQLGFSSQEEFNSYIQKIENMSSHNFDTNINNAEQIITLYTCYGLNNQRLLVCAVLVD